MHPRGIFILSRTAKLRIRYRCRYPFRYDATGFERLTYDRKLAQVPHNAGYNAYRFRQRGLDVSKKTIHPLEIRWLFSATRLPAILEADEAAALLGVASHSIPILVGARHLKPLGKPSPKAPKKFSSVEISEHSADRKWQDQAVRMIEAYWMSQNSKKSQRAKPLRSSGDALTP